MNVSTSENTSKRIRLYINVDHVATVREARQTDEPDPVSAASLCERAGADGITVHLREDRRHIQDDDVHRLARGIGTVLNLELATAPDIVALAADLRPHQATFVPERRAEITTEGGLALGQSRDADARLGDAIEALRTAGIRVSLFVDPLQDTIDAAAELGAAAVELHTGAYANAYPSGQDELTRIAGVAEHAREAGLGVHAGHGLTYRNVTEVAAIEAIEELSIGHTIVSRAITTGMEGAVREMRALLDAAR